MHKTMHSTLIMHNSCEKDKMEPAYALIQLTIVFTKWHRIWTESSTLNRQYKNCRQHDTEEKKYSQVKTPIKKKQYKTDDTLDIHYAEKRVAVFQ